MDIQQLREFLRLGVTLNFKKTAGEFNISQSTLSKHVAALEREVGTTLFDRTTREVSLTRDGIEFSNGCYSGIEAIDRALEEITARKHEHTDLVTVCGDLRCPLVVDIINSATSGYEQSNPHARVSRYQPHTSTSFFSIAKSNVLDLVRDDAGTVAVSVGPLSLENQAEFCAQYLTSEGLFAYVPNDHRLAQQDRVRLADLSDSTFVFTTAFPLLTAHIEEACLQNGFSMRKAVRACDSIADYFGSPKPNDIYIFSESCLTILPSTILSRYRLIRIEGEGAFIPIFALWNRGAPKSVDEFVGFLIQSASALRA